MINNQMDGAHHQDFISPGSGAYPPPIRRLPPAPPLSPEPLSIRQLITPPPSTEAHYSRSRRPAQRPRISVGPPAAPLPVGQEALPAPASQQTRIPSAGPLVVQQGKYISFFTRQDHHDDGKNPKNPILEDWPMADYLTVAIDKRVAEELAQQLLSRRQAGAAPEKSQSLAVDVHDFATGTTMFRTAGKVVAWTTRTAEVSSSIVSAAAGNVLLSPRTLL